MKEDKMSSAILEILDKNLNIIGYGEYNGTSDSVPTEFVINEDEIIGQKPYFLKYNQCNDDDMNHEPVDVTLFSNYGGGFYWPSTVCIHCKSIIGISSPYQPEYGYSIPSSDEQKFWSKWHEEGWPKSGDPRKRDAISD